MKQIGAVGMHKQMAPSGGALFELESVLSVAGDAQQG